MSAELCAELHRVGLELNRELRSLVRERRRAKCEALRWGRTLTAAQGALGAARSRLVTTRDRIDRLRAPVAARAGFRRICLAILVFMGPTLGIVSLLLGTLRVTK